MKRFTIILSTAMALLASGAGAQETVKIGLIGDLSGPFSAMSGNGSEVAAQMAIDDFGGTVLGREIEIVTGDSQNKPDVGAAIAKKWFEADGVSMVTDIWGSAVGMAVQSEARRADRIALFTGAGTADLAGKECSATGFVWTYDTDTLATAIAATLLDQDYDTWYFLTPDFIFGKQAQEKATQIVESRGGKVLGSSTFPITNQDFSSFLLNAQASQAKIVVQTGGDIAAAMKQANEFGILEAGQKFSSVILFLPFIKGIGTELGQGLFVTNSFYWDIDEATRAWSNRYFEKVGSMPTMNHAGTYSATLHYLKAVEKAGTLEAEKVAAAMREMPVEDATAHGTIRADGRLLRDYYMWQIKSPSESQGEWDLLKLVKRIPAADIVPPLSASACPAVKS
ncbi:MAG: ABC transporter substrate-binding protein [Hyphomicrobiales bacterium]|nr:ABC transporter substrate-binding protein [Hyphomicrobiales bacterium]